MKKRVVVVNGQKVLQAEDGATWTNERVEKAGLLRPGLYELFAAAPSDRSTSTAGVLLVVDGGVLYQVTNTGLVAHNCNDFDALPAVGAHGTVTYNADARASFDVQTPAAAPTARSRRSTRVTR